MVTKQVTLNPGESTDVSFNFVLTDVKTYQITCNGLTGSVQVTERPEAVFVVSNLQITPEPPHYAGDQIQISVTVQNVGTATGSYTVQCEIT